MEIKAINIKQKDYVNKEDFFVSGEVFIGPKNESFVYEVYDFNIISLKRLCEGFQDNGIMLNKGWMIAKYFDEDNVKQKISSIIQNCISENDEDTYAKIGSYFRIQES